MCILDILSMIYNWVPIESVAILKGTFYADSKQYKLE
jgi:hypothetical protein